MSDKPTPIRELMQASIKQSPTNLEKDSQSGCVEVPEQVHQFYSMLEAMYGSRMRREFPSVETLQTSKLFFANQIMCLTQDKIREGFDSLAAELKKGNTDYLFPDVLKIVGLCERHGEVSWQHNTAAYHVDVTPPERRLSDLEADERKQRNWAARDKAMAAIREKLKTT